MSFFIRNKQVNGIKRGGRAKYSTDKNKKRKTTEIKKVSKSEEITSSEDEGDVNNKLSDGYSSAEETAQEKKLRLAKIYLEEIEKEEKARLENEIDDSVISKRLKEDYLKETGKLRLIVADKYKDVDNNIQVLKCRQQRQSITCLCISSGDKYLFVGSKDAVVVKYSLLENKKVGIIPFVKCQDPNNIVGHSKKILSLAISTDSKFLAIGDESKDIYIWDPVNLKFIKKLTGHKASITGLCFKKDTYTLYSCSKDRSAKVWNLDEMAYVETLFGHQDAISAIDTLYKDRVVTSGGRDLRIWKIPEETQLIFNGHIGNIDNVKMLNEENFISGGDDGQICVWSILRKKPICVINNSHGVNVINKQPNWVTALTCLINTDLIASGSNEGVIKLWKLDNNFKTLTLLFEIPVEGFVNSMSFTSDGSKLIVAVSKEHRMGRWTTVPVAKNCIMVLPLEKNS